MSRTSWPFFLLAAAVLVSVPSVASANAGVPMLAIMWPGMGAALIPVVALETFMLRRSLGTDLKRTAGAVTVANLASTLLGVPVGWALMYGVQSVAFSVLGTGTPDPTLAATLGAAWLVPYESELWWMAPVAALVLFVPFFFVSWWSEYGVARLMLRDAPRQDLWRRMRDANLASYALLTLVPVGFLVAGAIQRAR